VSEYLGGGKQVQLEIPKLPGFESHRRGDRCALLQTFLIEVPCSTPATKIRRALAKDAPKVSTATLRFSGDGWTITFDRAAHQVVWSFDGSGWQVEQVRAELLVERLFGLLDGGVDVADRRRDRREQRGGRVRPGAGRRRELCGQKVRSGRSPAPVSRPTLRP
jgi:hypothetical protein